MANTQPASFGFSVVDELGVRASTTIYALVDPTLILSDQVTQWQALASALVGVIDGQVVEGDIRIRLTPTADQSGKPAAGSRVEQTEVTNLVVTGTGGKRAGTAVPSWADALITAGKPVIGSGAGATWVAAITGTYTGGVLTSALFTALGAVSDAFLSFRKRRKLLFRESIVEE
jgi:hypothetical protein